ncbi:MAG TPA: O-methyltransferase [Bryobacteraceae bacterium]|nr:O-methyltransferase [Bryobacteraceae bacterium]
MNLLWTEIDNYYADLLIPRDEVLEVALRSSAEAGLPAIAVSPHQGKMLMLLARVTGARKILEIGTLGGYSTIWLARGLADGGRLITLEFSDRHAEVARQNIARAGLSGQVEVRLGRAIDTLPDLADEAPFDLIFIDADKPSYREYLQWAVKLSRPGSLIIADNVVRSGAVADPASTDVNVQGIRRFNEALAAERRVSATAIQTVGSKGHDGFTIAVRHADH